MLASLTGLLLSLGGDQPAVVFDPPLDPSIFDWDGVTLKLKKGAEPVALSWPEPNSGGPQQMMIVNRIVFPAEAAEFYSVESGSELSSGTEKLELWRSGEIDGELYFSPDNPDDFEPFLPGTYPLASLSASVSKPTISFLEIATGRTSGLESRVEVLEEQVLTLEQALESCQCASDLDGDGSGGFTDLVELISVWGPCSA